jgi:ubiquinone/menaquinone biosynthesis C-methylase UbiE
VSDIGYLDAAAATDIGRLYKQRLLHALDVRPGDVALDVGCGPGTDLAALATAVGPGGSVIGVDHDPGMVAEARRRAPGADVREGDAHALPLPEAGVDRARADRVLQHLADPAQALRELYRVVRPGGRIALAEPDWYTLAVDAPDLATSRDFAAFLASRVRNPAMGRQLARLATAAGFTVVAVTPMPVLFTDFAAAEQILGLRRSVARAVECGAVPAGRLRPWLSGLAGGGPFLAAFTHFTVICDRPTGG